MTKAKELHATAKEFVPSWLNAAAKPAKSAAAVVTPEAASGKDKKSDPPAKDGAKKEVPASKPSTSSAKPPAAVESKSSKQAPAQPKAAPKPAVAAWGSKVSASVRTAAPIKPQQQQQNNSSTKPQGQQSGGHGGNKPGNAPRQQSEGSEGGDNGRRGGGDNNAKQQQQQQGGGGGWAAVAAKPVAAKPGQPQRQQSGNNNRNDDNRGGPPHRNDSHRQHSHRGGNDNIRRTGSRDDGNDGNNPNWSRGKGNDNIRRTGSRDDGNDDNNPNWSRGKAVPRDLLEEGEGETDAEKAVNRINVETLLDMRLSCLNPPKSWEEEDCATKPSAQCLWDTPTRVADIKAAAAADRIGGDVSRMERKKKKVNPNDTAPALEDCKPLEVNDETRWKAKVMDGKGEAASAEGEGTAEESKDEILRKATLILNKLSLTKFDKLSDKFIACGIGRDVETLTGAVGLIVNYAQEQQHFAAMYAGLCLKLANTPMEGIDEGSKKGKKFKKILLERCQTEFETDTSTKIKAATKDITNPEVIEYHATLIKKHYLGHMRFIGELYKGDLLSIKIMLFCLPSLLHGDNEESPSDEVDEEKVECFSKLMTVIGSSLEQQSEAMKRFGKADAANSLGECWRTVEIMAGKRKEEGPKVSNRMKYMLQDLLEMKEKGKILLMAVTNCCNLAFSIISYLIYFSANGNNKTGWVTRRKEETAKTLAQIHKEVAKEERAAAKRSGSSASLRGMSKGSVRRGASSGDVRKLDTQMKPQVDADGFVSVPTSSKGFNRSASMTAMPSSQSTYKTRGSTVALNNGQRTPSQGKLAVLNESDSRKNSKKGSSNKLADKAQAPTEEKKSNITYPKPDECGDKAKNILKEYFVGGDADDAVLSIHELVGAGNEGSVARGTKVVESAVLLVLEMKQEHVDKFLGLYLRCAKEKKIEGESFVLGLNDPLEFLADVAIDAPLAIPHLASLVAELVKNEIVSFDFLLNSPEYFRTDQNAADFGAKVMKKIGGDATTSESYIEVIEKLMTDEDKKKHSNASDLIATC